MRHFLLLVSLVTQVFAASKLYKITKNANCEGNEVIVSHVVPTNDTIPNQISFGGYFNVTEKIPGPLELSIEVYRCDNSMKKCEKYVALKNPGICEFFNKKTGLFTDILKTLEPRASCPLLPGKYLAKDSSIDLTSFAVLQSDGYTWMVTLKGISGDGKNKKLVMCLNIEAKILNVRDRKKKN